MSSSFSEDQLQGDDTLDDRGVDDILDEGMSPPERPSRDLARGITARDDAEGETLDERLAQEEPDVFDELDDEEQEETDPSDGYEIGDERTGRLAEDLDEDVTQDNLADDVGIDGGAASAEEAAVHTIPDDEL
jgi:hypothetical protein